MLKMNQFFQENGTFILLISGAIGFLTNHTLLDSQQLQNQVVKFKANKVNM